MSSIYEFSDIWWLLSIANYLISHILWSVVTVDQILFSIVGDINHIISVSGVVICFNPVLFSFNFFSQKKRYSETSWLLLFFCSEWNAFTCFWTCMCNISVCAVTSFYSLIKILNESMCNTFTQRLWRIFHLLFSHSHNFCLSLFKLALSLT